MKSLFAFIKNNKKSLTIVLFNKEVAFKQKKCHVDGWMLNETWKLLLSGLVFCF